MILDDKVILVTGGAGAIGSTLVKALIPRVRKIVVLDNLSSGYEEFVPKHSNVIFINGSVTEDKNLSDAFASGIDIVFHLAANFANQNSVDHPEIDLMTNGLGTLKLLKQCEKHKIKLFIYASSSCVYGDMSTPGDEDTAKIQLDTPYAITKWLGEKYTEFFHEHYGLSTVIVRIFNSYGPGEMPGKYRNVIPNFLKLALEKKPLPITGTGEETRTFNYIDNLIQAFFLVAETPAANGEIFNIGTDNETAIINLAFAINKVANNTAGVEFFPRRDWDHVTRRRANINKARRLLGYNPNDDLENDIRKTYEWIVQQYREK